jgi:hypothetical protein
VGKRERELDRERERVLESSTERWLGAFVQKGHVEPRAEDFVEF